MYKEATTSADDEERNMDGMGRHGGKGQLYRSLTLPKEVPVLCSTTDESVYGVVLSENC